MMKTNITSESVTTRVSNSSQTTSGSASHEKAPPKIKPPASESLIISKELDALCSGGGISFLTGNRNAKFNYGFSSFKGKRPLMEDYFEAKISDVDGQMVAFFGVFDGHGGSRTVEYLKNNLFNNLRGHPDFIKDTKTTIVEVFKQTDVEYTNEEKRDQKDTGSTASTVLLLGDRIFVANVGDSRVVVGRGGSGTWRVGGVLAVSRAFGDKALKPFVVADPEIQEEEIDGVDFIINASDGLWNVISNNEVVAIVQSVTEAEEASRTLIEKAYARGSSDNITCLVVRFNTSEK